MDSSEIYQSGEYLAHNPTWHTEDSPWKAAHILRMIEQHGLRPKTVAEIGCGAGEILNQLHEKLPCGTEFHGYEISQQAFEMSLSRRKPRLTFHLEDLLAVDTTFDMLLVIDVFEHVEDYMGFLRSLNKKASRFIFHIPLDLSAQTVLRGHSLIHSRESVGHLHYFTEETALATIRDTGYTVEDHFFTARSIELKGGGLKRRIAKLPRKLTAMVSESAASKLFGGFSLLVLARGAA